jgi:DNA-binding protein HU-beta
MAENDLLTRLLDAGMTFTALTQARAEELIRDLVRAGAVQAEHAQESVDELLARSRRNSERVLEAVRSEIDDQLGKLDLATRADIERLVHRFADVAATLVAQVAPDRARGSSTTASSRASQPAAVTSSTTASAKKAAAKKTTAKKSAAKKTTAKKTTAKKTTTAKKAAAKKAPAKKSTAKKTSGTKAAAKKAPAKKSSG